MRSLVKSVIMILMFWLAALSAFSQTPHIAYVTPQNYNVNEVVPVLSPSNTGGPVPATVYGTVSTFAGQPGVRGTDDGSLTTVLFNQPSGIAHDGSGDFYVVDNESRIVRKISASGQVNTFAGSGEWGNRNGQGKNAQFASPNGIGIDNKGNLYVADYGNYVIRKITPGGLVSTLAGSAIQALFYSSGPIATDNSGNVYIADYDNNKIKKITPAGSVSTFAGTGADGSTDGDKLSGSFSTPFGVAIDAAGNLFVADSYNKKLRKIGTDGKISTIAGNGNKGFIDGVGEAASFSTFLDLKVDAGGNIYVSDTYNHAIRLVTPSGRVITVAGNGVSGFVDGVGKDAKFSTTVSITLYNGAAYIVDEDNYVIRKMITTGYLIDKPLPAGLNFDSTTGKIGGTPTSESPATDYTVIAFNESGSSETTVRIAVVKPNSAPPAVVAKPDISYQTPKVYKKDVVIPPLSPINTGGAVPATIYGETKVIAGTGQFGSVNGDASTAQFKLPYGIFIDADGTTYIAENAGGIRMISASGQVSSIGTDALPGPPFNVPKLNNPRGVVKDKAGNLFVANYSNHNILKITPAGVVTVFAGINQSGTADGPGNVANIINPSGIAIDKDDNLYVTDGNNAIRKISPLGYVFTLAGQPAAGTADGQGRAAKFKKPAGIVVDKDGNIYVADQGGFVIRKITPNGFVSTIAGKGTYSSGDGKGTSAGFQSPVGITVDASGNVYVTDTGIGTVRQISPDGEVKTVTEGGPVSVSSGAGNGVLFSSADGITVGPDGNLYVAEYGKNSIRQVIATGYTIDKALPAGLTFDKRTGIITGTPTVLSPPTDYTVTAYNAGGSSKFVVNIEVNDVTQPQIEVGSVSGIVTACFGSVSANYQQFAISQIDLTDDVIVSAPANFEVSLSPNTGYSNSVIIPLADLILPPDGDGISVYVRLAATAPVGNRTGNVVLKSPGADDVNVPVNGVVKQLITPTVTIKQPNKDCPDQPVIFVADPDGTGGINPAYSWFINNVEQAGKTDATFQAPLTITANDKITVELTNTSDCTISPTATSPPVSPLYKSLPITVKVSVKQPNQPCPDQPVIFVADPEGTQGINPAYRWFINNVEQAGETGDTFQAPSTITVNDKVFVELTNTSDCTTSPTKRSVEVSPLYKSNSIIVKVSVKQPSPTCPDQPVLFVADPQGTQGVNPAYRWFINNVEQAGETGPIFQAPSTITVNDKISVELRNTSDCTISPTAMSLPVSPAYKSSPSLTVTIAVPSNYPACEGTSQTFTAGISPNFNGNLTYQWQLNGVNVGANNDQYTNNTLKNSDQLTCTVSNPAECVIPTTSNGFSVQTIVLPTVAFDGDVTIKKGEGVTLLPSLSNGAATYSWSPSIGLSNPTVKNPIASPAETTTYTLTVTATGGCPASATIKVTVLEQMVIPNAFTPNGDGVNDTWSIPGLAAYPNCEVNVYNRYGAGIFSSIGYAKNWNGSFNDYVLPAGTYYYTIDLKDGKKPLSGYVVLLK